MAFPQTPLDVRTELQLAGVWTDVTSDVYLRDPISISRGRADEGDRIDPGKCSLTFNNRAGKYSPRNPTGPYYGQLGRNTPVRVSVRTGTTYLDLPGATGDRATTPDAAALDILGDIDIRIDATLDNWLSGDSVELAGKYTITGNQRSWMLFVNQVGLPILAWSTNGTAVSTASSDAPITVPPSGRLALRVTLDVDNGAGGCTATFYTSDSISGTWTQLGTPYVGFSTTSIFNSTAVLEVGDVITQTLTPPAGQINAFQLRNGIGGSVVANPDFTAQTVGATSFADSAGRTWTVAGAASITNRRVRFTGEISSWPSRWDVSGKDLYVPVQAAGPKRRLGQGVSPLESPLRRSIPSGTPIAYWPMEDARDALQAASALPGGTALATSGMTYAGADTLPGSRPLPELSDAALLSGPVTVATAGAWRVEFVVRIDTVPGAGTDQELMTWSTSGTVTRWRLGVDSAALRLTGFLATGAGAISQTLTLLDGFFGAWSRVTITAEDFAGSISWNLIWTTADATASTSVGGTYAGSTGAVTSVAATFGAALKDAAIGHLAVFAATDPAVYQFSMNGYIGETAGARFLRLCQEQDIPASLTGDVTRQTLLGTQGPKKLLELLDEAGEADLGAICEERRRLALHMRDRLSVYNQSAALALNYAAAGEVAPPLEPTEDDQGTRNDITVHRDGGSSARTSLPTGAMSVQLPPGGVGRYEESVTLSLAADSQCADQAGWRLLLGTYDGARFPSVHVDLAAGPHLITSAVAVDILDRLTISNPPAASLPPDLIDLIVEGYQERIGVYEWDLTFNCSPGTPWNVGVLDDPLLGREDTGGSQLAAGATSTATSLSVSTTSGPLWSTSAGTFPFDIRVAGERMTVTNITGAASPQTFTVTRSVNGVVKAQLTAADVRLNQPMILAL